MKALIEKKCSACGITKPANDFNRDSSSKTGLKSQCRLCATEGTRKWRKLNAAHEKEYRISYYASHSEQQKETARTWHANNIERSHDNSKKWYKENKVKRRKYNEKYRTENKERLAQLRKLKQIENPEKVKMINKASSRKRLSNPRERLSNSMRVGVHKSLSLGEKAGRKWESLVGYTSDQLKTHIEKQFLPGMTWSNYGKWHIDHRIPISAFNFGTTEDIDFKQCWSLRNLRPLWALDNLRKFNKLEKPFQPSLAMAI